MRRTILGVWLCFAVPAYSWGPEGHALVARLAAAHLTPEAAARVKEILGPDQTLASVSSWADQVRRTRAETGPWHYIDIPIDKPHLDMVRDCPKGDCVIAKIEDFKKLLADPATAPEKRKEALMFIVHFVGDMHQPLHCSNNKDKGGNEVKTEFAGRPGNLHSVWDSGLLSRIGDENAVFAMLSTDLTTKRAKKLGKGTVERWAEQSHKAGQKIVYGKLPKVAPGEPEKLDDAYAKVADPLIELQLERAGARLATVLNTTLR
jgi:S1/P1 Nuclease